MQQTPFPIEEVLEHFRRKYAENAEYAEKSENNEKNSKTHENPKLPAVSETFDILETVGDIGVRTNTLNDIQGEKMPTFTDDAFLSKKERRVFSRKSRNTRNSRNFSFVKILCIQAILAVAIVFSVTIVRFIEPELYEQIQELLQAMLIRA
ncbi:MAG: hypothetical protein FWF76_08005 [Oscillospiraceae bacterium]|nr:hypothetical protein [Oscillospiraceae bacterium]